MAITYLQNLCNELTWYGMVSKCRMWWCELQWIIYRQKLGKHNLSPMFREQYITDLKVRLHQIIIKHGPILLMYQSYIYTVYHLIWEHAKNTHAYIKSWISKSQKLVTITKENYKSLKYLSQPLLVRLACE